MCCLAKSGIPAYHKTSNIDDKSDSMGFAIHDPKLRVKDNNTSLSWSDGRLVASWFVNSLMTGPVAMTTGKQKMVLQKPLSLIGLLIKTAIKIEKTTTRGTLNNILPTYVAYIGKNV